MEIKIITALQSIASRFLDVLMWLVTKLGEEMIFLLILAGIYLLYSKQFAFKYSIFYFVSVGVSGVVKMIFGRPRPYLVSNEVANRLPSTSEYSFPSGHTQSYFVQATTGMIEINKKTEKKGLKLSLLVTFIVLGVFVIISRMYWGQHYLSDTLVACSFGLAIPFVLEWLLRICPQKLKEIFTLENICKVFLLISIIGFAGCLVLDLAFGFASNEIYMYLAVLTSLSLGYLLDIKYIKYNPKSNVKNLFIKATILYVTLIGFYLILDVILPIEGYICYLVYLFLGLICTIIFPLLFKKLFNKNESVVIDGQNND